MLAVTRGQLVVYPNGAVAPFDPNNAAATKEHFAALAEVLTYTLSTWSINYLQTIYTLLKHCIHILNSCTLSTLYQKIIYTVSTHCNCTLSTNEWERELPVYTPVCMLGAWPVFSQIKVIIFIHTISTHCIYTLYLVTVSTHCIYTLSTHYPTTGTFSKDRIFSVRGL